MNVNRETFYLKIKMFKEIVERHTVMKNEIISNHVAAKKDRVQFVGNL